MDRILFQEIAHANVSYFISVDKALDQIIMDSASKAMKTLFDRTKNYYSFNVSAFCYAPAKYIEFVLNFEKAYDALLASTAAKADKEAVLERYELFLNHLDLPEHGKKTFVQLIGDNWHNIILVIMSFIFMLSMLDITFEMGFKLDRYLAVGSSIPTIYLLANYTPFKH